MKERLSVLMALFAQLRYGGTWWLLPVVVGLAIVGLLTVIAIASPLSPFLYPFF